MSIFITVNVFKPFPRPALRSKNLTLNKPTPASRPKKNQPKKSTPASRPETYKFDGYKLKNIAKTFDDNYIKCKSESIGNVSTGNTFKKLDHTYITGVTIYKSQNKVDYI